MLLDLYSGKLYSSLRCLVFTMMALIDGKGYIISDLQQRGYHYVNRENSPVTQTTPEPTQLSWSGWPREKFPPTPGHTASLVLSR